MISPYIFAAVVRGTFVNTHAHMVDYVGLVIKVQLVMKSINIFLTPGKRVLAVPLDPDWMCGCPGVKNLQIGETYLITGRMQRASNRSGYILEVNHKSLVIPWYEELLDDMEQNKSQYQDLIFRPSLTQYKKFFRS